jgi:hypothetical protein
VGARAAASPVDWWDSYPEKPTLARVVNSTARRAYGGAFVCQLCSLLKFCRDFRVRTGTHADGHAFVEGWPPHVLASATATRLVGPGTQCVLPRRLAAAREVGRCHAHPGLRGALRGRSGRRPEPTPSSLMGGVRDREGVLVGRAVQGHTRGGMLTAKPQAFAAARAPAWAMPT